MPPSPPNTDDLRLLTLQSRARALFGYHPSPIFELDPEGRFRHANLAAARFAGLHEQEGMGMHFSRFVDPDQRQVVEEHFQIALADRPAHCEARVITLTGQLARVSLDMLPIASDHGTLGVYVLLTPEAKHQSDSGPSEQRLFDALPLGAAVLDLNGEGYPVVRANSALGELLETAGDALLGKPLPTLAEPEAPPVQRLLEALAHRHPASERLEISRSNGQPFGVVVKLSPLHGEKEEEASQMLAVHVPA
ncbi:PAS domain-containing protein [uncultured Halomonas sp.]|uniref:PAS domain-containing protein n=1 Tax=uncultured Halomonas sp. TaxID=173971 RepID=UPI002635971B|nr:PAS domain-containing protein [uncultured Halomonas sp.]